MRHAPQDFDIFRIEPDGALVWCEAATTLEIAKVRVHALSASAPFSYMIRNQAQGTQIVITPDVSKRSKPPHGAKPAPAVTAAAYHICRIENDRLRWVEAAESLQGAASRIKVLNAIQPGNYLVLDYNPELRTNWTPPSLTAFYSLSV